MLWSLGRTTCIMPCQFVFLQGTCLPDLPAPHKEKFIMIPCNMIACITGTRGSGFMIFHGTSACPNLAPLTVNWSLRLMRELKGAQAQAANDS
jgi:hypothetical protein